MLKMFYRLTVSKALFYFALFVNFFSIKNLGNLYVLTGQHGLDYNSHVENISVQMEYLVC